MIRFGTLGAARITQLALIEPCAADARATVRVVAARSLERAQKFASKHGIEHVVADYQAVIDHPEVDVIYVPLPITAHREWTIKALAAGKHVLCEKSFACNAAEAEEMAAVARDSGLVLMDAFHYRYHPLFIRAREIYASGQLGKIKQVSADFHIPITDNSDIRMNYETGGGVTMDIGCYPISWVRHITASEPVSVTAEAEVGPKDVDIYLAAQMQMAGGVVANICGDMRASAKFRADIVVTGDKGVMKVNNPIAPQLGNSIKVTIDGETSTEHFDRRTTYSYQLDAFIEAVECPASERTPLLTGPDDAVKQMRAIDQCYSAAGLKLRGLR